MENTAKATDLIIKYPNVFKDYEITKGKMELKNNDLDNEEIFNVYKNKVEMQK